MLETVPPQAVISSDRFDLRPLRKSDKGMIEHYAGDLRVSKFIRGLPHPLPPGATEALIDRSHASDRTEDVWAIDGTKAGAPEFMGIITLERMDRGQSEIGYWVAPPFWNTGIASAAVETLIDANPQQSKTLFAEVFQDNAVSARVLTNCGFEYLGDAETFSVARNAKVATWTYSRKLS